MKGDKVDCNFSFWQKLFGFCSHKSLDGESASGKIGGLARAHPKLTDSFKETTLAISHRHHIHSSRLDAHQVISLLGQQLSLWRILSTWYTRRRNVGGLGNEMSQCGCMGGDCSNIGHRRPLRKAEAARHRPALGLEHPLLPLCTLTTLCRPTPDTILTLVSCRSWKVDGYLFKKLKPQREQ